MKDNPEVITKGKAADDNDSGAITMKDNNVSWHNNNLVFLNLDLDDVVVIGEHTNSDGPWFDDWFIIFVTKNGEWRSVSLYAHNIDELLEVLSNRFDPSLKNTQLVNSTTWKSIIRYPKYLEGIELFDMMPSKNYNPPRTWLQKLQFSLGFGKFNTSLELELNTKVKEEIAKACSKK